MSFRKVLLLGATALVLSIGTGCNSGSDKPPKAEVPPGTKLPEKKTPSAGGGPGGGKAGPGSSSQ